MRKQILKNILQITGNLKCCVPGQDDQATIVSAMLHVGEIFMNVIAGRRSQAGNLFFNFMEISQVNFK